MSVQSDQVPNYVASAQQQRPQAKTIGSLIDEQARTRAQAVAIVFASQSLTYAELGMSVSRAAKGFLALGIGKGDHVAIWMGSCPEWLIVWFALNKIGAVAVGISTWSTAKELSYLLKHSDAKALVFARQLGERDFTAVVNEVLVELKESVPGALYTPTAPFLRSVIVTGNASLAGSYRLDEVVELGDELNTSLLEAAQSEVTPQDVALICYTSGSSGTPKGVQLAHGIMIEHAFNIGEAEAFDSSSRFWLVLPLFWSAGSANTSMVVMTHGGVLVLQDRFDAVVALELFEQQRVTHYFAFPNVTSALYAEARRQGRTFPSLDVAVSTGNPEGLRMLGELGFKRFAHPYGTTEDYGFATMSRLDDSTATLSTSHGYPLPGIEIRIADPSSGKPLPAGTSGEICLRGHVTIGYYKDSAKNAESFDAEGFFHTADVGYVEANGRLHLEGRLKELIKTGGINVSPIEVEAVLLSHTSLTEAYVVGVPDDLSGEVVVAFVKQRPPGCTEQELRTFCRERLSSYKVPRAIEFRTEFPLTDTGKVAKRKLAEEARSRGLHHTARNTA